LHAAASMGVAVPAARLDHRPLITTDDVVRRAVWLARANPNQSIAVAGPDALEAMIALCRAGFDTVACTRQAAGVAEASDVLILAGVMTRNDLADTVVRTARLLRAGGALVVQLAHPVDDAVVRQVLAAQGLSLADSRFDVATGWLASHRVER
jgi:hypothetical protein